MAKYIKVRVFVEDVETNEICHISEVSANSKLRCKKILNSKNGGLAYYKNNADKYTISSIIVK